VTVKLLAAASDRAADASDVRHECKVRRPVKKLWAHSLSGKAADSCKVRVSSCFCNLLSGPSALPS
jgi:hypothetical protein